jgi:hypothetical protein
LLNAFPSPEFDVKAIADLASMLQAQNYQVNTDSPTVANLKTVGGDGVFYFSSHGGYVGKQGSTGTTLDPLRYAVWTATRANILEDQLLEPEDVKNTIAGPPFLIVVWANGDIKPHYAITARFVRNYFHDFSADSFVYLDACTSDDPRTGPDSAQDFKQALFDKKASVYAGWSDEPDHLDAANNARLGFDRLLGANEFTRKCFPRHPGRCLSSGRSPGRI